VPSRTTTSGDSAHRYFTRDKRIARATASYSRTNLHVWRQDEERHTLLKTCSWSSALLATQRRSGDAPSGKINHPRVTEHMQLGVSNGGCLILEGWEVSVDDLFEGLPESTSEFEFW
jgi:hypothetical protein